MTINNQTITGSVVYGTPTITPIDRYIASTHTEFVRGLYSGYNIEVVSDKRIINRNGNDRTCEEFIITNYKSNY